MPCKASAGKMLPSASDWRIAVCCAVSASKIDATSETRLARRSDPRLARAACPPHAKQSAADMEIARYLFEDRRLYTRTLVIGRPAVAVRPSSDARAHP